MIRRFAAGTALATGLALSLTGCLGDAKEKAGEAGGVAKMSALQVLGKTAEKTGQTSSFAADMSMNMTEPSTGNVTASGSMQYRTKPDVAWKMSFDQMSVGGKNMGGMQQILLNKAIYMKMPAMAGAGLPGGKTWLKMDLSKLGEATGMNMDQMLQQAQQMDPVQQTKMLTASKDAREVGKETVNGVQTTHFTGTYRASEALAQLPADQQKLARESLQKMGMDGMAFDLWVDDQQLPRKMAMKSGTKMSMTMTYRDFGKPVEITAPPAGQVTDFSAMMKNLGGGANPTYPGA
ncbi:LppX_LprAFG lipoprotein [Spirillospora sp. CA-294931]|uniref:LppX_LprAFG lipoprotein n=1 Tax=Spirillospora sp. CA-294931 TaxID=3240042 RepID=UPI003D89D5EA